MKLKKQVFTMLLLLPFIGQAQQLSSGEYFVDSDPGTGYGTAMPAFAAADSVNQTISLPTTGLSVGFHRVYYRYRNNAGNWSIPEDRLFSIYDTTRPAALTIQPGLAKREYFFDTDPGVGNATAFAFATQDSITETFNFNATGLAVGFHRIYLRYRNPIGTWSETEDRLFSVYDTTRPSPLVIQTPIVKGEYFVDTDPGAGSGTALPSFTAADSVNQTFNYVTSAAFTAGSSHAIHIRYMDQSGRWGEAEPRVFISQACTSHNAVTTTATTITATSTGAGITYQWLNCAGYTSVAGATLQSYTPPASGSYAVKVNDNGCIDTSACNSILITGLVQQGADPNRELRVFPNPASTSFVMESDFTGNQSLQVFDITGKLIFKGVLQTGRNLIDTSNLEQGIYCLSILRGAEKTSRRLVIVK